MQAAPDLGRINRKHRHMSNCSRCGAHFSCGMEEADSRAPCWCSALPPLSLDEVHALTDENGFAQCLCPACLKVAIDNRRDSDSGDGVL